MKILATPTRRPFTIALAGNPNSGKTTLFNALTGLRQKVANYPGVTVERKTGEWETSQGRYNVIDLPGCYSLNPRSPDEALAADTLCGRRTEMNPDATICVVDLTNLSRHLYLAGQIIEIGRPVIVALTMVDEAEQLGLSVDVMRLSYHLGVPVVAVVAAERVGVQELEDTLTGILSKPWVAPGRAYRLPPALELRLKEYASLAGATDLQTLHCVAGHHVAECTDQLEKAAQRVRTELGVDEETVRRFIVEARYAWQRDVTRDVVHNDQRRGTGWTRRLDDFFLHRVFGPVILAAVLALVFQAVFSWASFPMDLIRNLTSTWLPSQLDHVLGPGPLLNLINKGVLAGVGSVLAFLPQILLLYLFLTILEDSGYLSRAAFILDRLMVKVGLSGRSFIPLLSSFACAIPGIMATRTIPHAKDRLTTILVAPLMTCSARLVVYTMLIAAFIPATHVWGPLSLQGLTLLGLYVLGIAAAASAAAVFRRTILRGPIPPLLLELPPYRLPRLKTVALALVARARTFLVSAGTIIFAVSIILWALFSYPHSGEIERQYVSERTSLAAQSATTEQLAILDARHAAEQLQFSLAGKIGRAIEPILQPLGFDWKIGIGMIGSFAARELFVSTMGIVYGVGSTAENQNLVDQLKVDRNPKTGEPVWTPLVALTLLVFYAFALQCVSTMAVMRRETNSWRWPTFAFVYMSVLAYGAALLTRLIGNRFF